MASVALTRVSGTVLATSERSGTSRKDPENPRKWKMVFANVLVADQNVTVVQLPTDDFGDVTLPGGLPVKGEEIDYLTEVSIFGRDVQVRVLGDFPALVSADA